MSQWVAGGVDGKMDGRVVVGRICRPSLTRSHGRGYGFPFDQLQVYLAEGKYFVCSDVGKGRMQWYAMLGQPAGNKVRGSARVHLRSSPDLPIEPRTDDRPTDRPTDKIPLPGGGPPGAAPAQGLRGLVQRGGGAPRADQGGACVSALMLFLLRGDCGGGNV